jgi:ParB family chromosome partitioning protein
MEKLKTLSEIKEILLADLVLDKAQVRTVGVGHGIKELADSIRKIGLLEPIVVCPSDESGKYEILAGQRRFLAHKEIGATTIKAVVLEKPVNEIEAKAISLTENMLREELPTKDMINVCTYLYKKYGSVKHVAEETGLPTHKVSEYVKYDRLIPSLKEMVDKGEVDLKVALRAQDAASVEGEPKTEDAVKLAKEMRTMTGIQQKKIVKEREKNPSKSADTVIEEAKSGRVVQIYVSLGPNVHTALQKYAKVEETSQDDAASSLIEEGLIGKGFIETETE